MPKLATKKLTQLRKKPGKSNAYKYPREVTAGDAGTYPLTKNGKPSLSRAESALRLAHNAPKSEQATIKAKAKRMIKKIKSKK